MRYVFLGLMIVSAGFGSSTLAGRVEGEGAGFTFPGTDWISDSYAFGGTGVTSTITASYGSYAVIDDFDPGSSCMLEYYICWGVTTASPPSQLELLCVEDSNGAPEGAPFSQITYTADCLDSGFEFAGYTILYTELYLLDCPVFYQRCWLGAHRADGNNWYTMTGTTVSGSEAYRTTGSGWNWEPYSQTVEPGDIFKVLGNYNMPALGRTTWAGVKGSF